MMEVDEDMEVVGVEIGAGEMRGGVVMTGTGGEEEKGGPGQGVPAGRGPGAGETGGAEAGAPRGSPGGLHPPRGVALLRRGRQSLDHLLQGGRRGGAGAGAKKPAAQISFLPFFSQARAESAVCTFSFMTIQ